MLERREQTLRFNCCSGRDAVPPSENPAAIQADQAHQVRATLDSSQDCCHTSVSSAQCFSCLTLFDWAAPDEDNELIVSA